MIFIERLELYLDPSKITCIWHDSAYDGHFKISWVTTNGSKNHVERYKISEKEKSAIELQLKEAFNDELDTNLG